MELLGVVDALEATLLSGSRIPLTDKIVIEENKIIPILDRLRELIRQGEGLAKHELEGRPKPAPKTERIILDTMDNSEQIVSSAYQKAQDIKRGADEYADQVLANLQVTVTKIQRNLLKMEQTLDNGRRRLTDSKNADNRREGDQVLLDKPVAEEVPTAAS
jgi:hypothetical protein